MFQTETQTETFHFGGVVKWNRKVTVTFPLVAPFAFNLQLLIKTKTSNPNPELGLKGWYGLLKDFELEIGGNRIEYITGDGLKIWGNDPEVHPLDDFKIVIMYIPFSIFKPFLEMPQRREVKVHVEFALKPTDCFKDLGDAIIKLDYKGMYHTGWVL